MSILGLDVGTSGCKATIIDESGNNLGQAYQEYSLVSPQPGWLELDPEAVWLSVRLVIQRALIGTGHDPIQAISVSSFGEAVVAIDRSGQVLGNSLLYIDSRGQEEAEFLKVKLGNRRVLEITGTYVQPMYSLCKIMWLNKHQPELYRKTWKYLLFADFILFRLGARPHTDYSLAARTMAFDIIEKQWSAEILDCAGVLADKFAEPVQSGTLVGQISPAIAAELGLPGQAALVAGGHDQPCAALGAGVTHSALAVDGLGTTECITPAFANPVRSDDMASKHFACVPHVLKDFYVTYAFTFTCGSILKWYLHNFGQEFQKESSHQGISAYDLMINQALVDPAPSPVFVLPHFAGAATPYMDMEAKGAIIGLNIGTSAQDILKAALEGITFEIMVNLEHLANAGIQVDELRTVGGLAKSEPFLQLKANMMGKKITALELSEAGTVGVAILAGTAIGMFRSSEDAVARLVRPKKSFYPDERIHRKYLDRFESYKRIYPAVKQI